jgi:RNA polymerase sigma-70 factor (ECF subfamily)
MSKWVSSTDEDVALACPDKDAVAELFRRFNTTLTSFISKRIKHQADVDDLVQSIFIDIARGKAPYNARSKASSWLCGIAINKMRMLWKSSQRRTRLVNDFGKVAITSVNDSHGMLTINAAVAKLPEGLREAFKLCEIEGLTAREASEVLSTTEDAVWKRLSYARAALSKRLGDNCGKS